MQLHVWSPGEDLGGDKGRESVIRKYSIKVLSRKKKEILKSKSADAIHFNILLKRIYTVLN